MRNKLGTHKDTGGQTERFNTTYLCGKNQMINYSKDNNIK